MPGPRQLARLALVVLALAPACREEGREGLELELGPKAEGQDLQTEASERVEAFLGAPAWEELTGLLGQDHARARELLGPHQLRYTAELTTGPARIAADEPLPPPDVDRPILERFAVTDTLELRWGAAPGGEPRLALDQHNEHERGRSLVVIGEQAWAQVDGRGWLARPLETDLWQLWANDAQHAVLDLVELAGPHAELAGVEPTEVAGRPALRVRLRASEQQHPGRTVEAPTPWRRGASVEIVEATLDLDRATGLWLAAKLELNWQFEDSAGRDLAGRARFEGSVEVLDAPPLIEPPAEAQPTPERDRPQLLRQRMLDGLAGP